MLASDKLEQLRAGFRPPGTTDPLETRGEQTEYLDVDGRQNRRGRTPTAGSMYVRLWSVAALPGSNDVLVLRVSVAPIRPGGGSLDHGVALDGARLVTLVRVP